MRKLLLIALTTAMMMAVTACGGEKEKEQETTTVSEDAGAENATGDSNAGDSESEGTIGEVLYEDFKSKANGTAQEIADGLLQNSVIQFMPASMPVEPGFLNGFDNAEIKGFKEGVMFGPAMGTMPFIGYIFTLEDGADVDAFKTTLKDSANLRWNICTEAEEMVVESEGNTVFFLMCPKSFEQPEAEGDMPGNMDMGDVDAGDMPADMGDVDAGDMPAAMPDDMPVEGGVVAE